MSGRLRHSACSARQRIGACPHHNRAGRSPCFSARPDGPPPPLSENPEPVRSHVNTPSRFVVNPVVGPKRPGGNAGCHPAISLRPLSRSRALVAARTEPEGALGRDLQRQIPRCEDIVMAERAFRWLDSSAVHAPDARVRSTWRRPLSVGLHPARATYIVGGRASASARMSAHSWVREGHRALECLSSVAPASCRLRPSDPPPRAAAGFAAADRGRDLLGPTDSRNQRGEPVRPYGAGPGPHRRTGSARTVRRAPPEPPRRRAGPPPSRSARAPAQRPPPSSSSKYGHLPARKQARRPGLWTPPRKPDSPAS